ncbi:Hypothetical protein NTJ_09870 [Nesidiocoris tenuis]|uniref:Uncharacterized protein n=1 Tax=Nesidiocoris tenuis TaxID=355587 RepID=A0ABN7AXZ2_9HEMI|nr:Hypothetical protein NTJ_09870 [Nesidiocoris tenuis]
MPREEDSEKRKKKFFPFTEALDEECVRKSELRNKVDVLNFRADQVQSQYAQAEVANKKLLQGMNRLRRREQEYIRRVDELNQELERIRSKIHETYR